MCCEINQLDSQAESRIHVTIYSTFIPKNLPWFRVSPSSVLYIPGLLLLVVRCSGSLLCAISPAKWLLFINQDFVKIVKQRERTEPFLHLKKTRRKNRNVTGSWCRSVRLSRALINSANHLWFTALSHPFSSFSPCSRKKRQTKQVDRRTDKQTDGLFNWCWHFFRTGAVVMIDLSCSVHWRFKEKSRAQRRAHELKESVRLSPPAVTLAFDWFESSRVNFVSSTGACEACGYRYFRGACTC